MRKNIVGSRLFAAVFCVLLFLPAIGLTQEAPAPSRPTSKQEAQSGTPQTFGGEIAQESQEAAGEDDQFKKSPSVQFLARVTNLLARSMPTGSALALISLLSPHWFTGFRRRHCRRSSAIVRFRFKSRWRRRAKPAKMRIDAWLISNRDSHDWIPKWPLARGGGKGSGRRRRSDSHGCPGRSKQDPPIGRAGDCGRRQSGPSRIDSLRRGSGGWARRQTASRGPSH